MKTNVWHFLLFKRAKLYDVYIIYQIKIFVTIQQNQISADGSILHAYIGIS